MLPCQSPRVRASRCTSLVRGEIDLLLLGAIFSTSLVRSSWAGKPRRRSVGTRKLGAHARRRHHRTRVCAGPRRYNTRRSLKGICGASSAPCVPSPRRNHADRRHERRLERQRHVWMNHHRGEGPSGIHRRHGHCTEAREPQDPRGHFLPEGSGGAACRRQNQRRMESLMGEPHGSPEPGSQPPSAAPPVGQGGPAGFDVGPCLHLSGEVCV